MQLYNVALITPGSCYDALNNLIWTCSSDYMDQWSNPGNQAFHHVCKRLGVSHVITEPRGRAAAPNGTFRDKPEAIIHTRDPVVLPGEAVRTTEVISQLLHHIGAMCIHQLNAFAAGAISSGSISGGSGGHLPPGSSFLSRQPMEAWHFHAICDIMEKAMVNSETCIIRCILVVFQVPAPLHQRRVGFRRRTSGPGSVLPSASTDPNVCFLQVVFRFFNPQLEHNRESLKHSRLLLWQLLMAPVDQIGEEIQREVCLAIRFHDKPTRTIIINHVELEMIINV